MVQEKPLIIKLNKLSSSGNGYWANGNQSFRSGSRVAGVVLLPGLISVFATSDLKVFDDVVPLSMANAFVEITGFTFSRFSVSWTSCSRGRESRDRARGRGARGWLRREKQWRGQAAAAAAAGGRSYAA